MMWNLISGSQADGLQTWLLLAWVFGSRDGSGPMWWAFEKQNDEVTKMLMNAGVPNKDRDSTA